MGEVEDFSCQGSPQKFVYMAAASMTFNVCVVLYVGAYKVFNVFLKKHQEKQSLPVLVVSTQQKRDDNREDIAKFVSFGISGLVVSLMSIYALISTDVTKQPFVSNGNKEMILIICSLQMGRYIFFLFRDIYSHRMLPRDRYVSCLHHVASTSCYITVICSGMNLFLSLICVFMEMDHYLYLITRILRKKKTVNPNTMQNLSISGLVIALCCRVVLPTVSIAIAVTRQNPMTMSGMPLGIFCFGVLFFTVFSVWTVITWIFLIRQYKQSQCTQQLICKDNENLVKLQNDLTYKGEALPKAKDTLLIAQIAKLNNVHTITNLQSNFSNQHWSKTVNYMAEIGGTKATLGRTEQEETSLVEDVEISDTV